MLRIGICDDEDWYLANMEEILSEYCDARKLEYKIYQYKDGYELITAQNLLDIIFLDIEMTNMDGIEAARKIREKNMDVPIIYITNHSDYWRKAYSVHAFEYIEKPFRKEQISQVMDDYYKMTQKEKNDKVLLITDDGIVPLKYRDIYYFLIEKKKSVRVSTITGDYIVNENLADIYNKLHSEMFYMPHRCCIINLRFVCNVVNDYDIIMENGEFLPLAQKKKEEFLHKLSQQFVNKLKGKTL